MKIITLTNFRSGGKSSIARLLAEELNASILNFDTERDAEYYNAVSTLNITKDKKISRTDTTLILSNDVTEQIISSKSGYIICDLGGYFDPRIKEIHSDIYILPTFDDFESMRETIRTASYILKYNLKANILFILNGAFIGDKKEKEITVKNWNKQLELNNLDIFQTIYMPKSNLIKKLVNNETTKQDVINQNQLLNHSYKNINDFIKELLNIIKG